MKSNHKTQRINGPRRYPNCSTSKTKPTRIIAQSLLVLILCMLSNVANSLDPLPNGDGCCGTSCGTGVCATPTNSLGGVLRDYFGSSSKDRAAVIQQYGSIENWDVSEVTDMTYLFTYFLQNHKQTFNSDISRWRVNRVTNFYATFYSATGFNIDLFYLENKHTASISGIIILLHITGLLLWDMKLDNSVLVNQNVSGLTCSIPIIIGLVFCTIYPLMHGGHRTDAEDIFWAVPITVGHFVFVVSPPLIFVILLIDQFDNGLEIKLWVYPVVCFGIIFGCGGCIMFLVSVFDGFGDS